jgi:acetylornithine deacetylase
MGRVLSRLERLDRSIQACHPHPIQGAGSLHASLISGGRELSTYPDTCTLSIERRTVSTDPKDCLLGEVEKILDDLRAEDPEFNAFAKFIFGRPPYLMPDDHPLPGIIEFALARKGVKSARGGMS